MYYTYVLRSEVDSKFYVGYTKDLKLRFENHCKGYIDSTKNRRPLKLIYYEACLTQQDALQREKYFKTWHGRQFLHKRLKSYLTGWMPTHIHLLASPRENELQEPMRDLFSRYAMRFNKKYMRKGHLFAGPYRQAICLDDTYLLSASLYIHMNPVRAGLVDDPRNFRWSSVRVFYDSKAPDSFLEPHFVLRLLSSNEERSKEIYQQLMLRSAELDVDDALEQVDAVARFRKALGRILPSIFAKVSTREQMPDRIGISLLDEEEIENQLAAETPPQSPSARRFLIQQLIARGYKRQEIADKLNVSVKTIYNILHAPQWKYNYYRFRLKAIIGKQDLV